MLSSVAEIMILSIITQNKIVICCRLSPLIFKVLGRLGRNFNICLYKNDFALYKVGICSWASWVSSVHSEVLREAIAALKIDRIELTD